MAPPTLRAALSALVLIGLAEGCASSRPSRQPAGQPTMTAEDIEQNAGDPIEKVLQSKASGVLVKRTADGGIAVEIRGVSSFYGSNAPLYVIDDAPFNPGPGGALTGVNPYDIESIRVLKNPEDTGIYGMRGANGVIVIKTKRPGKRGT
jgi:TonB-dependent SusC/RagA subfamily outer membrane receptor